MSLNAKKVKNTNKGNRPPALEPGTYPARLVWVLSLGLQAQRPYKGEEKEPKIEIYMTYELADEFLQDEDGNDIEDKPRFISEAIPLNNLNSDLAKSTKRYYALDPTTEHGGDFAKLVGTPCMLTISANPAKKDPETIYNNIVSVQTMRAKDADKLPELVNPTKIFDFDEPDMEVFWSLPEWLQEKIKESLEYGGSDLEDLVKQGKPESGEEGAKAEPKTKVKKEEESDDGDW